MQARKSCSCSRGLPSRCAMPSEIHMHTSPLGETVPAVCARGMRAAGHRARWSGVRVVDECH